MSRRAPIAAAGLLAGLLASCASPSEETFEGRAAWRLENDQISAVMLQAGGHLASLTRTGDEQPINPLWKPHWPSFEPRDFDRSGLPASPQNRWLAATLGHAVSFDNWGLPTQSETDAGLQFNGEAGLLQWELLAWGPHSLRCRVEAPNAGVALRRTLRLVDSQPVLYFEETAENLLPFDRAFGWVQNVQIGGPFLDSRTAVFDASATVGEIPSADSYTGTSWRRTNGETVSFRSFPDAESVSQRAWFRLDPAREISYVSALDRNSGLLLIYVFFRRDFPWLIIEDENRNLPEPPWNEEGKVRSMQFGNTIIPGRALAYSTRPSALGIPTHGVLSALGEQTTRYMAVLVSVEDGFDGVSDLRLDGEEIVVTPWSGEAALHIPYQPLYFDMAELRGAL